MIPKFEIRKKNKVYTDVEKIDVSRYTRIELIDAREVSINPDFKYAVILPVFSGLTCLYPDELPICQFYLNDNEIELSTDTIEHMLNYISYYTKNILTRYWKNYELIQRPFWRNKYI